MGNSRSFKKALMQSRGIELKKDKRISKHHVIQVSTMSSYKLAVVKTKVRVRAQVVRTERSDK